ncbi:MAG: hypothetical protein ACU826_00020 [Gammaproteobacteria bacterium]
MTEEQALEKDNFWFYVGGLAALLIVIVFMVKSTENEKFSQIKELENEELNLMNVRVLKDY